MRTAAVLFLLGTISMPAGPLSGQTAEAQNKQTVEAMTRAINDRDLDALDELMAPNLVRHSQSTPGIEVSSLEDFKAFLRNDLSVVPDSEVTCPMVVAEGDLVATWCRYEGTQTGQMGPFPPSGKRMSLDFAGILRFEEGKIAEMWVVWDNLTALAQTGHIPPPAAMFEGEQP